MNASNRMKNILVILTSVASLFLSPHGRGTRIPIPKGSLTRLRTSFI